MRTTRFFGSTAFGFLAGLTCALACACHSSPNGSADAHGAGVEADARAPSAKPAQAPITDPVEVLAGSPWIVDLIEEVDGGPPRSLGVVTVPLGATRPRPIVIALHGGGDRPEWACGEWRTIAGGYPFVVCPRGPGTEAFLSWSNVKDTEARTARALEAVRKRFRRWIAQGPIVLVGFSRGALQAGEMAQRAPYMYPRIALSESAFDIRQTTASVRRWASGGARRVLFGCTTRACEAPFRALAKDVAARGVPSRVNIAGTNKHGVWDVVVQSTSRDWPWLVEGLPGWQNFETPTEDARDALPGKTVAFEPTIGQ